MNIADLIKKKIEETQRTEREILKSMQDKDFAKAIYLDNKLKQQIEIDKLVRKVF